MANENHDSLRKPHLPIWSLRPLELELLEFHIKESWVGLVLRYDGHWGKNSKPPAFMVKEDTTVEEFKEAVENEVLTSGDDHHIFIETFRENEMWLDIITGS